MISIQLTDQEAELFKRFRQWQDTFSILVDRGVFSIRGGEAHLYFSHDGVLMQVERTEKAYVRQAKI